MNQVRKEKLLHGWRDPVSPRPAATVILLRDAEHGLEILMTRRSLQASFAPGAYVFPGGRVDAADHVMASAHYGRLTTSPPSDEQVLEAAFAFAAVRESFEELGVLLTRGADGRHAGADLIGKMNRSPHAGLAEQLAHHSQSVDLNDIIWFSHWITDPDLPKRFDTRFFIAKMPDGQQPIADETEQFEPIWINPARGLAEHEAGRFNMIFPTIRTLRQLLPFENSTTLLAHCRGERQMWRSSPRGGLLGQEVARYSENETAYGELEMVTPDGKVAHRLDWQHEAVPLLKHVTRITAPNPGRMTGPGTNTYIVGEAGRYVVIDPGPNHTEHLQRIAAIVGNGLSAIVCTHSHPDHYPGAKPLREMLGKNSIPIMGRPSGPNFNPAWQFEPDELLNDGDIIDCGNGDQLRALHTPGHASNHVCLLLEPDGLLFSGDHILNGSTTVIDHPDGNMKDYLLALERLAKENLSFILPAHGYVLGRPHHEIDHLIKHRLKREGKVVQALRKSGGGTLDDLVLIAYDDVDKVLHPVAKRSLSAHLYKLVEDGQAQLSGDNWRIAG